jgi:hypothetical protein
MLCDDILYYIIQYYYYYYGTAIPLQDLTGPEGSKRLRLPEFKKIGTLL